MEAFINDLMRVLLGLFIIVLPVLLTIQLINRS